jgi:hypothetical protein
MTSSFLRRSFFSIFTVAMLFGAVQMNGCKEEETKPPVENSPANPKPPGGGGSGEGGTSTPTDGGDAGSSTADAGACTDLVAATVVINEIAVQGDPPAGTGGTILDGTYNITDSQHFIGLTGAPGVTGNSYQGSIRISGGGTVIERHVIFKNPSNAASEYIEKGTFIPGASGNGTVNLTCPTPMQESVSYTVNGNNLVMSNLVTKASFTYGKVQ